MRFVLDHSKKGLVTCEGIIFKIFFLNDKANCFKTLPPRKRYILIIMFFVTHLQVICICDTSSCILVGNSSVLPHNKTSNK